MLRNSYGFVETVVLVRVAATTVVVVNLATVEVGPTGLEIWPGWGASEDGTRKAGLVVVGSAAFFVRPTVVLDWSSRSVGDADEHAPTVRANTRTAETARVLGDMNDLPLNCLISNLVTGSIGSHHGRRSN